MKTGDYKQQREIQLLLAEKKLIAAQEKARFSSSASHFFAWHSSLLAFCGRFPELNRSGTALPVMAKAAARSLASYLKVHKES